MATISVLINVAIMLAYMACGYILTKAGKATSDHARSLSGVLIYICGPCMVLSAFQGMEYDLSMFSDALVFFGVSFVVQILFLLLMCLCFRKKLDNPKYRVLTVGSIAGNVGFFGLPIITGIFPDAPVVACYSTMYTASMNIIVFTVGVYMLTRDKKHISVKDALLNPATLAAIVCVPLYLLRVKLPEAVLTPISLLGKMTTPLCMIVLGMRLATMKFGHVFTRGFAYILSAMKLIAFPLFAYGCVYFIPWLDDTFKVSLCILSSAPTAAVMLSLAELYECERKICANAMLLATLGSLITMPLIALLAG